MLLSVHVFYLMLFAQPPWMDGRLADENAEGIDDPVHVDDDDDDDDDMIAFDGIFTQVICCLKMGFIRLRYLKPKGQR